MGSRLEHRPKACFDGREVGPMRVVVGFSGRRGALIGTGLNGHVRSKFHWTIPSTNNDSVTRAPCPPLVLRKPHAFSWSPAGLSGESVSAYSSRVLLRATAHFVLERYDGFLPVLALSSRERLKELPGPSCKQFLDRRYFHRGLF